MSQCGRPLSVKTSHADQIQLMSIFLFVLAATDFFIFLQVDSHIAIISSHAAPNTCNAKGMTVDSCYVLSSAWGFDAISKVLVNTPACLSP